MVGYKKLKTDEGRTSTEVQKPTVFVGIDLHRITWHVTIGTDDHEFFSVE